MAMTKVGDPGYDCSGRNCAMALSFDSPRFSLRTADFCEIDSAIENVGHAVLEDVWNPLFIAAMLAAAKQKYAGDDAYYSEKLDKLPLGKKGTYLQGVTNLPSDFHDTFDRELERSGITALLRQLFHGSFVIDRSERAIRRVDPAMPVMFTGLHHDHQLEPCIAAGKRSHRAVTMWTPLHACLDDLTPRLLLLRKGQTLSDGFAPAIRLGGSLGYMDANSAQFSTAFDRIYEAFDCFAPRVPSGGMIIFDHRVVHGTYRTPPMTTTRYSIDCRAVGEYRVSVRTFGFSGMRAQFSEYPLSFRVLERLVIIQKAMRGDEGARRLILRKLRLRS
ncbi:MAG: hypothetical protein ACREEN_01005 [Stellaceae bacterium]